MPKLGKRIHQYEKQILGNQSTGALTCKHSDYMLSLSMVAATQKTKEKENKRMGAGGKTRKAQGVMDEAFLSNNIYMPLAPTHPKKECRFTISH